jgi:beta-glucanase (GH16 family)
MGLDCPAELAETNWFNLMMRNILRELVVILTGLTLAGPVVAQCVYIQDCELVWSDEFDGTSVDTNKWEFMIGDGSAYGIPGWGNNELQYYRSQNATVANGELTITAKQESFGGKQYTSARLRTLNKGDWTYGRMEMRAKLPVGQGMWPAFWMLGSNSPYGGWAASGEIDIMESIGSNPERIYGSIHYGGEAPANNYSGNSTYLAAGTATDWHVYAVEWQEGIIRWFVDGQLYSTQTSWYSTNGPFPAPFDVDFHLLLNLAVGGYFPGNPDGSTVFPQQYIIDYVRVYQTGGGSSGAQDIVFDDMEHGNPFGNGWYAFNSGIGGGGLGANYSDLPPSNGGSVSLQAGWGSGGAAGYLGGFGRRNPMDITGLTHFSFWINPDAGQDYRLEINIQEDDNGDNVLTQAADDEFQYVCHISPSGPCAVSGGGWQLVEIPISSFVPDNTYLYGGNNVLDTVPTSQGGNGQLLDVVIAIITNSGTTASFRTDYWLFENKSAPIAADVNIPRVIHPHHNDENVSPYLDDVIPVVVYGASTLVGDAEDLDTALIDAASLKFGPGMGGISPSHPPQYALDVDSDGIDDARFRFLMSDSDFSCSDDSGTLVGGLSSGEVFEGSDSFISNCDAQCH